MRLRLLILLMCAAFYHASAQIPIDSTLKAANKWPNPTQTQYENWFFNYWYTSVLQPDSIKLRIGNAFKMPFDGRDFVMTLDSVKGTGNLRNSFYHWRYVGWIVDSVTHVKLRDTTLTDTLSLPFTNWGEVNRCGVVENPSYGPYIGKMVVYSFKWINEQLIILPTMIFSSGDNTQVLLRLIHAEMGPPYNSGQPTGALYIPGVSVKI